jgi:hypothetical protein
MEVTGLAPDADPTEHMRVDQLEDPILNHTYELFNEAHRDLPVSNNRKTARRPAKAADGRLAAKLDAALTARARTPKCRTGTKLDLRATPIRSGSLCFGC